MILCQIVVLLLQIYIAKFNTTFSLPMIKYNVLAFKVLMQSHLLELHLLHTSSSKCVDSRQ